jgi:hypothetical protein
MKKGLFFLLPIFILAQSCATFKAQYSTQTKSEFSPNNDKVAHTFILVGDAGNGVFKDTIDYSSSLVNQLNKVTKNSTLLYLGDNIYPAGMPNVKDSLAHNDAVKKLKEKLFLFQVITIGITMEMKA